MRNKNPETRLMETAIEQMAASNRKTSWTTTDVVNAYIKLDPNKSKELEQLLELDRKAQAHAVEAGLDGSAHVHRDREFARLRTLASNIMGRQMEEDYGLHRRFGCWKTTPVSGKKEFRWFEIRYSTRRFFRMWRDMKENYYRRCGLRLEDTNIILAIADAQQTENLNRIWRDAMREIVGKRAA